MHHDLGICSGALEPFADRSDSRERRYIESDVYGRADRSIDQLVVAAHCCLTLDGVYIVVHLRAVLQHWYSILIVMGCCANHGLTPLLTCLPARDFPPTPYAPGLVIFVQSWERFALR